MLFDLSVIIPVYNVEEFLPECLNSVLMCTKNNMEVILVDDGSTDNSGSICDDYAIHDPRIKVFHKKNGGLSSARNYGLEYARGEYIGFVDSDDIICENMFIEMLGFAHKYNADIVICGMRHFYDNLADYSICVHADKLIIAEDNSRLAFFIDPNSMGDYSVNKVYKRTLFETGIRFPEDHIFEDIFVSYKLFGKAKKVVCLDRDYYYYRYRTGSVSRSNTYNPKMIDIVNSTGEQLNYIKENAPEYLPFAYQKHLDANIIELHHILSCKMLIKKKDLVKLIRKNVITLLKNHNKITRFEKEAKAIKKGIAYWWLCYQVTDLYNGLNIHPKVQKFLYTLFQRQIYIEKK